MATSSRSLPSGRVTFAFIDVVGSTRSFIQYGDAYARALRALHATVAEHTSRGGGVVVETEGDGAFLAFPDASAGVAALLALQGELASHDGGDVRLRIRAGAHVGDAEPVGGQYLALPVYVAARVAATANAGQLLVTDQVVEELTRTGSAPHPEPVDTGTYSLKDLTDPVRIWRITGDPVPPRATPARRTNVQPTRTSFVGRADELVRLRELVSVPGLVSLVGPGGTGKTRLASELALRDSASFEGGAWLVELATIDEPDQVVGATSEALGLAAASMPALIQVFRHRGRCLLIMDNCEHLLDGVSNLLDAVLPTCPELTVLCTSREALNLAAERVWRLPPLPVREAGTQLFLERSELDTDDMAAVHRLCEALDGLPLAIELAASQARTAQLREILDVVTSGGDPLARRGGEERQRSLDAVLAWSLDRLPGSARAALLTLSVLPGRFGPEMGRTLLAAAPACDPDAMRLLARTSLIDRDGPDYRLLWTVRDAARRALALDGTLQREAMEALVTWAARFGDERYTDTTTDHGAVTPDTLLALELALTHGLETGAHGLGRAWNVVCHVTDTRGAPASLLALCDRALDVPPLDPDKVRILRAAATTRALHGQAIRLDSRQLTQMRAVAERSGDPLLLRGVVFVMSLQAQHQDQREACLALRRELLRLAETEPRLRHTLPRALINLGLCYEFEGDLDTAASFARRGAEEAARSGDWAAGALALANLAEYELQLARAEPAREHASEALRLAPPDWRLRPSTLSLLARAHAALGETEAALAAGRESLAGIAAVPVLDGQTAAYRNALLDALPALQASAG